MLKPTPSLCFRLLLAISLAASPLSLADEAQQSKVESAFIFQFTNYVTWPSEKAPTAPLKPFIISILGDSPVVSAMEALKAAKKIKSRSVEIHKLKSIADLKASEIILILDSDLNTLQSAAQKAKGSGALIITHSEGFAKKGAMINFYVESDRVRFEINPSALEAEGLQASSQLLKLARMVE